MRKITCFFCTRWDFCWPLHSLRKSPGKNSLVALDRLCRRALLCHATPFTLEEWGVLTLVLLAPAMFMWILWQISCVFPLDWNSGWPLKVVLCRFWGCLAAQKQSSTSSFRPFPDRDALIGSAGARSQKEDLLWSKIGSNYWHMRMISYPIIVNITLGKSLVKVAKKLVKGVLRDPHIE